MEAFVNHNTYADFLDFFMTLFSPAPVVNGGPFSKNFPCNHIINIYKKSFSGEVKDSVIFLFFFNFISFITLYSPLVFSLAHLRELKTCTPPLSSEACHPSARTQNLYSPLVSIKSIQNRYQLLQTHPLTLLSVRVMTFERMCHSMDV